MNEFKVVRIINSNTIEFEPTVTIGSNTFNTAQIVGYDKPQKIQDTILAIRRLEHLLLNKSVTLFLSYKYSTNDVLWCRVYLNDVDVSNYFYYFKEQLRSSLFYRFIDKLFLIREIRSKEGILHFRRWRIIQTPWFNLYVHGIYRADEDEHLHDHPWDYVSLILSGAFTEDHIDLDKCVNVDTFNVGQIVKRKAEELHKIRELDKSPVYTLFLTGKRRRQWGYSVNGQWLDNITYRKQKNATN